MTITAQQLRQICPTLQQARAVIIVGLLNELCPRYGMDTADEFHEFIAQVAHESAEFSCKEEGLNYSVARLCEVWPGRFPNLAAAQPYARDSQKLANYVYASRMGNGNAASGDGFRFRGAGFIQMTGRDMFTKFARYKKVDVGTVANYVHTDDRWALDSALWIFCIEKSLLDEAQRDEFIAITRAINGGTVGLADRQKYYERAKAVIK